jgi:CspA family cold shock protein
LPFDFDRSPALHEFLEAVEKAGHTSLSEGAKISYELLTTRSGKTVAAAAYASPG